MQKFRFHLLALPNTQTTREYSLDGFCQATIRFARMLKDLGHTIILYASEENEAPCDELVTVITKEEQETLLGATTTADGKPDPTPYQYAYIEEWSPIWQLANARTVREIGKRKQEHDFICSIGGGSQSAVAKAHPEMPFVEWSIGYMGSFSPYRVFESYAWMHHTYANQQITNGRFFDTVIPCPFDPAEFPFQKNKEPFILYVGRLVERKGIDIVGKTAAAAKMPLKIIGHGSYPIPEGAEFLGAVSADERNHWMARAQVVMTPTMYIEPFNQVTVEAQFCGTPVVATNFGGFTETIEQGKTGFRCNYLGEFVKAVHEAAFLKPNYIRKRAVEKYSMHNLKHDYQNYFERLALLWDKGWDTL